MRDEELETELCLVIEIQKFFVEQGDFKMRVKPTSSVIQGSQKESDYLSLGQPEHSIQSELKRLSLAILLGLINLLPIRSV